MLRVAAAALQVHAGRSEGTRNGIELHPFARGTHSVCNRLQKWSEKNRMIMQFSEVVLFTQYRIGKIRIVLSHKTQKDYEIIWN